jgi:hypothetical protein
LLPDDATATDTAIRPPAAGEARTAVGDGPTNASLAAKKTNSVVAATFNNGDPFVVAGRFGLGRVILLTAPLDADWSTLPAKSDYVPFLHETIFQLAAGQTQRNVSVGEPLMLPLPTGKRAKDYACIGPGETLYEPTETGPGRQSSAVFGDTRIPGIYRFEHKPGAAQAAAGARPELFVVNCDRRESHLRLLNAEERRLLAHNDRLSFVSSIGDLTAATPVDDTPTEHWRLFLLAFAGILVCESFLTRHLVKGGHAVVDEPERESHAPPEKP